MTRWYGIAGLRLRLDGEIAESDSLDERYHAFSCASGPADLRLEIETQAGFHNQAVAQRRIGDCPYVLRDGHWTVHRIDYEGVLVAPGHLRARTDGTLGALNGVLRHLLVLALIERGGLLLHSAGVIVGGSSLAIPGSSGAGKSTACRHAPAWTTVQGDEQLAVRPVGAEIWAWGTPIVGEWNQPGRPDGAPLSAIHFIEHSPRNRSTPVGVHEAMRRLVGSTVFYPRDAKLNSRAIDNCVALAARVPAFRLEAKGDGSFWPLLTPAREALG